MICPGVKRPPPMGSELVNGLLLEGVCGVRRGVRDEGVFRMGGGGGAIVAPSRLASSPSRVAPVSESIPAPQEEQNFPVGETCAPQFEQNMGGGDSTIGQCHPANAHAESGNTFNLYSGPVGKHFGDALHHFRGVVA